jgi:hypothetical protein
MLRNTLVVLRLDLEPDLDLDLDLDLLDLFDFPECFDPDLELYREDLGIFFTRLIFLKCKEK